MASRFLLQQSKFRFFLAQSTLCIDQLESEDHGSMLELYISFPAISAAIATQRLQGRKA